MRLHLPAQQQLPAGRPGPCLRPRPACCRAASAAAPASSPAPPAQQQGLGRAEQFSNNIAPLSGLTSPSTARGSQEVQEVHSKADLDGVLEANSDRLVVLMCKALSCRPCKMFARKYHRCADAYKNTVFLEVLGDENTDTRRLMMSMGVKVTPTFYLWRGRSGEGAPQLVQKLTGINENKLREAITEQLVEGEARP